MDLAGSAATWGRSGGRWRQRQNAAVDHIFAPRPPRRPGGPPVIDAQQLFAPERAGAPPPPEVAAAISAACSSWGFFQLTNHGSSAALLERMDAEARAFFALPLDRKLQARALEPAEGVGAAALVLRCSCRAMQLVMPSVSPEVTHPPCPPAQVRRSADNAMGFAHDELTKQARDLKEASWSSLIDVVGCFLLLSAAVVSSWHDDYSCPLQLLAVESAQRVPSSLPSAGV